VGFRVLDVLAERLGFTFRKPFLKPYMLASGEVEGADLVLVKPLTYMNRSGDIFPEVLSRTSTEIQNLLVVCDTLDLPAGQCRLRRRGSSAGHKGLSSIIRRLGRDDFMRLYIGVGHPGRPQGVIEHVLGEPEDREAEAVEAALQRSTEAIVQLLKEEPERVMNVLNQKFRES
jgi:PTH1 family peptidyl-tRNA hydrolase